MSKRAGISKTKRHRSIYISEELLAKIDAERFKHWKKTGKEISFNAFVTKKLVESLRVVKDE